MSDSKGVMRMVDMSMVDLVRGYCEDREERVNGELMKASGDSEYAHLRDLVFGKGWETEEDLLGLERLPLW